MFVITGFLRDAKGEATCANIKEEVCSNSISLFYKIFTEFKKRVFNPSKRKMASETTYQSINGNNDNFFIFESTHLYNTTAQDLALAENSVKMKQLFIKKHPLVKL